MPEGNGGSALSAWLTPLQHFYRTSALPCPYLPARVERKVITELAGRDARPLYDELSRAGFRRSHNLAYRPACPGCNGCVPVRVDAAAFRPGPSMRRVIRRNADLARHEIGPRATAEQYRLFVRYQRARHGGSDMADMTFGDYRSMVEDSPIDTRVFEFRDAAGRLVAACLADRTDDGFSAVYSFFETEEEQRSLGTLMVLSLVRRAVEEKRPYVYLGYWIRDSAKMAYKTRFRPLEQLGPRGWERLDPG
jgi:arginyl-tRNA--protein-N-Asp/Glu arginylyltransferase